ncbi:hypothetical protein, partial [Halomonas salina]|uniref:hypothetical protein n=1 Tax=Halomonas salina TaxID=42565 RepID=UPI001F1B2B08
YRSEWRAILPIPLTLSIERFRQSPKNLKKTSASATHHRLQRCPSPAADAYFTGYHRDSARTF